MATFGLWQAGATVLAARADAIVDVCRRRIVNHSEAAVGVIHDGSLTHDQFVRPALATIRSLGFE